MIVLDEQLGKPALIAAIERWYPGSILLISAFRPNSNVLDDVIPALLLQIKQPTFVTINVKDFSRADIHHSYCIVRVAVPSNQVNLVPELLRAVLNHTEYRAKAGRMGKLITVYANGRILE